MFLATSFDFFFSPPPATFEYNFEKSGLAQAAGGGRSVYCVLAGCAGKEFGGAGGGKDGIEPLAGVGGADAAIRG